MSKNAVELGQSLVSRWGRPARLVTVAILALLLLIPLQMVESVVRERYHTYQQVVADIAGAWSSDQLVAGPALVVPYSEKVEVREAFVTPEGERRFATRWETRVRRAVLLPDTLELDAAIEPESRHRGIYRVQVFSAELRLEGRFGDPEGAIRALSSDEQIDEIFWPQSVVAFGLSDPRGIVRAHGLLVDQQPVQPGPGTTLSEILPRGFHLSVGAKAADGLDFDLPMVIRGSGSLKFLPLGESTRAAIRSSWPHPSFVGRVLPASRSIEPTGFAAEWTIPLLNRSYPQAWTAGDGIDLEEVEAGVRLFEPVALYDMVTRAVKYGLLFIVLTFLTLGLIELVLGTRLSLVQFLLIGVALALFFLILIALAEHLGFGLAYVLASTTVVAINTLYCAAILRSRTTSAIVGGVLSAIYGILYVILEAEDYALLGGTALLVAALVVTMYFTRRLHEPAASAAVALE
jgi:inner membrane protein